MPRTAITVEEAVERVLAAAAAAGAAAPGRESAALIDSAGRVAARTIHAKYPQPPFDRSPLDGFALHHEDTVLAAADRPAHLAIAADVFAGDSGIPFLERGRAVRILTGAPIPPGATCVVRQEDVAVEDGTALVPYRLEEGENRCLRGENLREGDCLVREGERIDLGSVALLAGDGVMKAPVFARPRVAILSTGNELSDGWDPLEEGMVYDINSPLLTVRTVRLGGEVVACRTVRDNELGIAGAMRELFASSDLVVTTGGVSVGERDFLPAAVRAAGATVLFHGVDMKPGSPALAAERGGKIALCLSGNPFAAFVTFELLAAPAIRRLSGLRDAVPERISCVLAEGFFKSRGTRRFMPGRLSGGTVFLRGGRDGGRSLATLAGANCLVDIPAGDGNLDAGAMVEVLPL